MTETESCFYCQAPLHRSNTRHLDGDAICAECHEDLLLGGDIEIENGKSVELDYDPDETPQNTLAWDGVWQGSTYTVNTADPAVQPRLRITYPEPGDVS